MNGAELFINNYYIKDYTKGNNTISAEARICVVSEKEAKNVYDMGLIAEYNGKVYNGFTKNIS